MCKKVIWYILILLPILLLISACAGNDTDKNPNTWPCMVRIDGVDYVYELDMEEDYMVDDSQVIGYITSVVPITQGPTKDDEANFPAALDAPYVRYSDDEYPDAVLVPFGECWHLFCPSERQRQRDGSFVLSFAGEQSGRRTVPLSE